MTRFTSWLAILAVPVALDAYASPAEAQLSRTFVSATVGNDANNCDRPTPCRTFQAAHDKTNPDGEITVLDTGGYGAVTITKSISIVSEVGEASVLVSGGATGIIVNAGAASYVNLRGLTIQGIGFGGGTGLVFNSGFTLTMTNCVVRNHTGNGIIFQPSIDSHLSVSNTLVADNGVSGIWVHPSGNLPTIKATFNRVEAYNNSLDGILVDAFAESVFLLATVVDSVAAGNGKVGFAALGTNTRTDLMVIRSVAVNNSTGLLANGQVVSLLLSQSTVADNTTSWLAQNNGRVQSYGDNNIDLNFDQNPGPPVIPRK